MAGFGGGPWGGGPWGGSALGGVDPVEVAETVTISEALAIYVPLQVDSALSLSPYLVEVYFSHDLDLGYAPNFDPSSYSIAGLIISAVIPGVSPSTVFLVTDEQGPFLYTVIVSDAKSAAGDVIDLLNNSAIFAGWPIIPTVFATAQSRTKIQLTFSTAMLQNVAYTDPTSYTITDLNGTNLPVVSATAVGPSLNRRLALEVGTDLEPGGYYVATIVSALVQTDDFLPIIPNTDLFQWNETPRPIPDIPLQIRISDFSGEVSSGLLGQPLGQVFFSPSLENLAPNSTIQVDEISCCTRAFDVYTPPSPPDPTPLYTFGGEVNATLGTAVLWATWNRLFGAQINLTNSPSDTMGAYDDGPCTALLEEPLDKDFISLLNNSYWTLFDGVGTPFITADNLAPIPPGPTVGPIVLQP